MFEAQFNAFSVLLKKEKSSIFPFESKSSVFGFHCPQLKSSWLWHFGIDITFEPLVFYAFDLFKNEESES